MTYAKSSRALITGTVDESTISSTAWRELTLQVKGLGFRVWGLGFQVWGLGFGVQGSRFGITAW
jgi:hypothetical protein